MRTIPFNERLPSQAGCWPAVAATHGTVAAILTLVGRPAKRNVTALWHRCELAMNMSPDQSVGLKDPNGRSGAL